MSRAPPALLILILLCACTPSPDECDPAQPTNIFLAAICDASGAYDRRQQLIATKIDDREATLQAVRKELGQASSRALELASQRRTLDREAELLDAAMRRDARELDRYRSSATADQKELEGLERRLAELREQRLKVDERQQVLEAAIRDLTRAVNERREALQQVLDTLAPGQSVGAAPPPP